MSWQERAVEHWYRSRPGWKSGSQEFRDWITETSSPEEVCLEIGPGPGGKTSAHLANCFRAVDGLDIDAAIRENVSLRNAYVYDGNHFPLPDAAWDYAVSDYVLEHVSNPVLLLRELFRVLKPGGWFCFRTPNLLHYASMVAWLTPHSVHRAVSHRLRRMPEGSHEVYPTHFRMNTVSRLRHLAASAGFSVVQLYTVEKEPSYGMASRLLFYPFLAYERIVNASRILAPFRCNIHGMFRKPGP